MMHDPTHPGEVLQEDYLEPLALSAAEVASGLGISRRNLTEILRGRRGVTPPRPCALRKPLRRPRNFG